MMRSVSAFLVLSLSTIAFAQESTDKLRSSSDKAQNLFDSGLAGSSPTEIAHVEEMPEYPGGQAALLQFITQNTKYPDEPLEQGVSGKVFVQFIVEKNGKVDSVHIKRSVHPLLDQEAVRVVGLLADWTPGKMDGKAVPVKFVLPISFTIPDEYMERIRKKSGQEGCESEEVESSIGGSRSPMIRAPEYPKHPSRKMCLIEQAQHHVALVYAAGRLPFFSEEASHVRRACARCVRSRSLA